MAATCGIGTHRLNETPFAVIDFETTGMHPGNDRVVEVAVLRFDPGSAPRLVFDSLLSGKVYPRR
jgi:DNA polymerase-3 subunit epsilon